MAFEDYARQENGTKWREVVWSSAISHSSALSCFEMREQLCVLTAIQQPLCSFFRSQANGGTGLEQRGWKMVKPEETRHLGVVWHHWECERRGKMIVRKVIAPWGLITPYVRGCKLHWEKRGLRWELHVGMWGKGCVGYNHKAHK